MLGVLRLVVDSRPPTFQGTDGLPEDIKIVSMERWHLVLVVFVGGHKDEKFFQAGEVGDECDLAPLCR